jgi:hypothetical protein
MLKKNFNLVIHINLTCKVGAYTNGNQYDPSPNFERLRDTWPSLLTLRVLFYSRGLDLVEFFTRNNCSSFLRQSLTFFGKKVSLDYKVAKNVSRKSSVFIQVHKRSQFKTGTRNKEVHLHVRYEIAYLLFLRCIRIRYQRPARIQVPV